MTRSGWHECGLCGAAYRSRRAALQCCEHHFTDIDTAHSPACTDGGTVDLGELQSATALEIGEQACLALIGETAPATIRIPEALVTQFQRTATDLAHIYEDNEDDDSLVTDGGQSKEPDFAIIESWTPDGADVELDIGLGGTCHRCEQALVKGGTEQRGKLLCPDCELIISVRVVLGNLNPGGDPGPHHAWPQTGTQTSDTWTLTYGVRGTHTADGGDFVANAGATTADTSTSPLACAECSHHIGVGFHAMTLRASNPLLTTRDTPECTRCHTTLTTPQEAHQHLTTEHNVSAIAVNRAITDWDWPVDVTDDRARQ